MQVRIGQRQDTKLLLPVRERQPGEWETGRLGQAWWNIRGKATPCLKTGAFIELGTPISFPEQSQGVPVYQAWPVAYMRNMPERTMIFITEPHFHSHFHRLGSDCSVSCGNLFYTVVRFLQCQIGAVQCSKSSGMTTGLLVQSRGFKHR